MPTFSEKIQLTIGPLSEYGWLSGLSLNDYVGRKGSYSPQSDGGVDPFRKPGVLQAGYVASSVNAFITTQIIAMQPYLASGSARLYGYDTVGKIYQLDTGNHANVSVIASLQTFSQNYGFAITRDYLFAAFQASIGFTHLRRIGPLSTGLNATTINISLTTQVNGVNIKHVLLPWKSNLYCLHGNNIDYLDGNGVATGILTLGARLPSDMVQKCATAYGDRLAIGASNNLISSSSRGTRATVYLYDGVSNDWQREIPFPENDIVDLAYDSGELLAWGINWLYKYNPTTGGFEAIEQLDGTSAPGFHGMHSSNNGQVWFPGSNAIRSYGSPIRYLDRVMNKPYGGVGTGGVCVWISNSRLYVSNSTGSLTYLSASALTGIRARTRMIDFGGAKARLVWFRPVFETLVGSEAATFEVRDVSDSNLYVIGSVNVSSDGAIASKEFWAKDFSTEPPYMTEMQISVLFDSGNFKLRRMDMIFETAQEM